MKKNIILSLLATLVSVLGISAQENTYSMVIKLNNGTVLTIGPNEVDSISFNDGQVAFSGENISALVGALGARIDSLSYSTDANLNDLRYMQSDLKYMLSVMIDKTQFNTTVPRLISPNIYIQDSYWYVNGEKTYKYADSNSLYVGDNGNWWLGRYSSSGYYDGMDTGMDTGIKARSIEEVYQKVNELMQIIAVLKAEIENLINRVM